jgi:hypothetical protein
LSWNSVRQIVRQKQISSRVPPFSTCKVTVRQRPNLSLKGLW